MPLAFDSASHGRIAFGFFNIEVDLLLLEHLFFWADDFCTLVEAVSRSVGGDIFGLPGFKLKESGRLGNLHGAIAGQDLSGLIGSIYGLFPFPADPDGFRQKPYGQQNRPAITNQMKEHLDPASIEVDCDPARDRVSIGGFRFDKLAFQELVRYVWVGGMPRWQDDSGPDYVRAMAGLIRNSKSPLLTGLELG